MKQANQRAARAHKKYESLMVKTIVILLLSLIIAGPFLDLPAISADNVDLSSYYVTFGDNYVEELPESLSDGEIWTGKNVQHETDGTITVTLSAWGKTYYDWDGEDYEASKHGEPQDPLSNDAPGNGYVVVKDYLYEFRLKEGEVLPDGVTKDEDENGVYLMWQVHQRDILSATDPATVSYILELDPEGMINATEWKMNYWYSTGTAEAIFYPAKGNQFYWTMLETTFDSFTMDMKWNNGNGLNGGLIVDSVFNASISFGKNTSPESEKSFDAPSNHWAFNARCDGTTYWWHLEWEKTNGVKTYYFTVRDFEAPGIDIVYEVIFPNPGGMISNPASRNRVSQEFFHRNFEDGNPNKEFNWVGDAIVVKMDAIGLIHLNEDYDETGSLMISKLLEGWYYIDWGVEETTDFHARVRDRETGNYLTFDENAPYEYTFTGTTGNEALASTILKFSKINSATIAGLPVGMECVVEELDLGSDLIEVSYTYSGEEEVAIISEGEIPEEVFVTNKYAHGVGFLEIFKIFDELPPGTIIDDSTIFYARVFDVEANNYLIFKNYQEPDGTYRCVGNDEFGLSEDYTGTILTEVSFSVEQPVRLSNLWTWGRYRVEEGYIVNGEWVKVREVEFVDGEIPAGHDWFTDDSWVWGASYSSDNGTKPLDPNDNNKIVVAVTNMYKPVEARLYETSLVFTGTKTTTGKSLTNGQFQFAIYEGDTVVSTGTNTNSGLIIFSEIIYTQPGQHTYTVKETSKSENGWTVDDTAYTIYVTVTEIDDTLSATAAYPENGVVFHNTYDASWDVPETGDGNNMIPWLLILDVSILSLIALIMVKTRKRRNKMKSAKE